MESALTMRTIAGRSVPVIGLGCMNLSHAYGAPPDEREGITLLRRAFELGYRHFDTATLYGFGRNESLIGKALHDRRDSIFLASKGGMAGVDGKRVIDGRPETLRRQIDGSLRRLQTDFIDLYYLHRVDRKVPVEESLGALREAVQHGKIGAVGLSEVSRTTLERAIAVCPIAAVQNEYSIWTRNCELGVSDFCAEQNIALVAFSPICRGFVAMAGKEPGEFVDGDIRRGMPRFRPENFEANTVWLSRFLELAATAGMSPAQLALAWLIAKGEHVAPIPGTTNEKHLADNFFVCDARVSAELEQEIDHLMAPALISGNRYPEATQSEIDTERFPFELDRS